MHRITKTGAALASLALVLSACGSDEETPPAASAAPSAGSSTFTIWADEIRTPPLKAECDKFAQANGIIDPLAVKPGVSLVIPDGSGRTP